jgi:hypothetical protein
MRRPREGGQGLKTKHYVALVALVWVLTVALIYATSGPVRLLIMVVVGILGVILGYQSWTQPGKPLANPEDRDVRNVFATVRKVLIKDRNQ